MCLAAGSAFADSLGNAVRDAVASNPLIGEAGANRRAIDAEVDQAQGLYRPKLDVEAYTGPYKYDRSSLADRDNREWRLSRSASVVLRQTLFDGFFRANEVFRQYARVNGAAARVLERSEVVALDAVEVYVDLIRHYRILELADQNIAAHRGIVARIADLARGGTATTGDRAQAEERLAAAECPKSWGQAAHTLKGSALAVGANEVGRLALAAEQEGFAAEPERRRRRVQELEAAVDRVVTFIAEVLAAR